MNYPSNYSRLQNSHLDYHFLSFFQKGRKPKNTKYKIKKKCINAKQFSVFFISKNNFLKKIPNTLTIVFCFLENSLPIAFLTKKQYKIVFYFYSQNQKTICQIAYGLF